VREAKLGEDSPGGKPLREGKQVGSILSREMQASYEMYKKHDAWNINSSTPWLLAAIVAGILGALAYLCVWLDRSLCCATGLRFVPVGAVVYCVYHTCMLWAEKTYWLWESQRRGVDLVPRKGLSVRPEDEVERIRQALQQRPLPAGGERLRIVCCSATSGGGHEATTVCRTCPVLSAARSLHA